MHTKKYTNQLIKEKSPYLLQHAHNPVDWFPWAEAAFEKAKKENKVIFLSVGYSTCHWCHVMEHESFEDEAIAQFLNEHYVAIKVDREERPDIDSVYMTSVMAMSGQGGWPLSVFLTPEKRPFFGGTYFPPYPKWGAPGFLDVLKSIHQSWMANASQIITSSVTLTEIIKQRKEEAESRGKLTENSLHAAYDQFAQMFDQTFGGFGQSPKFPSSHNVSYLLKYYWKYQEPYALQIADLTLKKMANGGLQDHLGGGFHRYSTDQEWQIPHFEKMLYDQALLSRTYVEAFQMTKNESYAQTARNIFDYVLRDMQDSQGGFFSAEDADSIDPYEDAGAEGLHKKEGAFFLWRQEEIVKILSPKEAEIFCEYFGIEPNGNAKFDPHGEFTGKNILWIVHDLDELAKKHQMSADDIWKLIETAKVKLFQVREKRKRPHLDDKILTDWNGLMMASLAYGARVLNDDKYLKAAQRASDFIEMKLSLPEGKLLHRFRDGESALNGTLEDYAFYVYGLLELHQATLDVKYLKRAYELTLKMLDLFWDDKRGGFFQTSHEAEELIFRAKESYDGAIPSGNSMAADNLLRLYHLTGYKEFQDSAEDLFDVFAEDIMSNPGSYAQFLSAFLLVFSGMVEIFITEGSNQEIVDQIKQLNVSQFLPQTLVLKKSADESQNKSLSFIPFWNERKTIDGKTTVYICQNHQCQKPLTEMDEIIKAFKV